MFCEKCGKQIEDYGKCPFCGQTQHSQMRYNQKICFNCEKIIDKNSKCCPKCGHILYVQSKNFWYGIVFLIICIFFFLVYCVFSTTQYKEESLDRNKTNSEEQIVNIMTEDENYNYDKLEKEQATNFLNKLLEVLGTCEEITRKFEQIYLDYLKEENETQLLEKAKNIYSQSEKMVEKYYSIDNYGHPLLINTQNFVENYYLKPTMLQWVAITNAISNNDIASLITAIDYFNQDLYNEVMVELSKNIGIITNCSGITEEEYFVIIAPHLVKVASDTVKYKDNLSTEEKILYEDIIQKWSQYIK